MNVNKLEAPELTNKFSLEILTKEQPVYDFVTVQSMDFRAKYAWERRRNPAEAYYFRVLAAKSYEKLALGDFRECNLEKAALAYDKASKNAIVLGFTMAAIRCRIRSCILHTRVKELREKLGESQEFVTRNLSFAQKNLITLINHPLTTAFYLEYGIFHSNQRCSVG